MRKMLLGLLVIFGIVATSSTQAATIFDYNSDWNYYQTQLYNTPNTDYTWSLQNGTWNLADYNSFDWSKMSTSTVGNGSFATNNYNTYWTADTGLALTKTFNISKLLSSATLSFGLDNGAIIFINGNQVIKEQRENGGWQDQYAISVDTNFFKLGENTISVLAEDHGGQTYFDAKLEGTPTTPEPSSMLLGIIGATSLFGLRRKK